MAVSKRVKLDVNVLLEWVYDDNNVMNDNYTVISNLNEGSRGYVSTKPLNSIDNNLFTVDSVLKRYSKINLEKFNFLQKQDYAGILIPHDKVKIYFPVDYNFPVYKGFNLRISTLDYTNKNVYTLCNYYYDKALDSNIGTIELITPFNFNEKFWGKCITLDIPSIYNISKDRVVTNTQNIVIPNTINYNLTNGVGLSQSAPIFIDYSFITTSDLVLGSTYYTLGDMYETSVPQQPEYQSLGVEVVESTQGDFFEIYGIFQGTNELLDNFVADLEAMGKKIEINYTVTLYEEGIQSGYPQTFVVTENFAQKLLYRPIIRFSNTTASIDVVMNIFDIVNNSSIERFASIGLTKNIFKYGKTLSRINLDSSIIKPKIYKAMPETLVISGQANVTEVNLTKVPFPLLYDKYKILVNSTNSINSDYKSNGLLNIIITPFDTVMKFTIAKAIDTTTNAPTPYDLSEMTSNASLKLIFTSTGKSLEKDYYIQSDENNFEIGVIIYKINSTDLGVIKEIYSKGFKNFYLTLVSSSSKTLLYSGTFEFYENLKFVDLQSSITNQLAEDASNIANLKATVASLTIDKQTLENSLLNVKNIPYGIPADLIKDNKNYFNVLIFLRRTSLQTQFDVILNTRLGITNYIYNDFVYYIGGLGNPMIEKIATYTTYVSQLIKIDIYDGQNKDSQIYDVATDTVPVAPITTTPTKPITTVNPRTTGGGGGGGGGCFTPESLVLMSDYTHKMIKDIRVNDSVMSYDLYELPLYDELQIWSANNMGGCSTNTTVAEVLIHDVTSGYFNINNNLLNITGEHIVLIERDYEYKFLSVNNIEIGDHLHCVDGSIITVKTKDFVEYTGKVYNLTLNSYYLYYVNDVLVHNVKERTQENM